MTCVWCNTIIFGVDSDWQCHWCGWLTIEVILKRRSNQQAIQTYYKSHHLSYVPWWFIIASTVQNKVWKFAKTLKKDLSHQIHPPGFHGRMPDIKKHKSPTAPWEAAAFTSKFSFFSSLLLPSARRTDQRFASALTNHLSFEQQMVAPFMSYSQMWNIKIHLWS